MLLWFTPRRASRNWPLPAKFAALLFLAASSSLAVTDNNNNGWYSYFGDHPFASSRWGLHLEGQWRRADVATKSMQLLLRPAVNFQLRPKVMLTGGYGFVETNGYGDYPAAQRFPEHRTYEQVLVNQRALRLDWTNRLRLEQRHIGGRAARYENRFRYMLRTNVPLPHKQYYIALSSEIFFNFGKNVASNVFDQNRAIIALGRKLSEHTRLEVGYMEQTVQQRSGRVFEHNHTLQISVTSRLPFGK